MRHSRHVTIAVALLILGFFLHFTIPALRVRFGPDEMMNLYTYWAPGGWSVVKANFTFWSTFNRPMGALYYLTLFSTAGFTPWPYNALRIAILLANTILFYLLAVRILPSRWSAAFATLVVAYHAEMSNLAYNGAFIYDVLCAFFYFAAVLYYLYARSKSEALRWGQTGIFLVLYICALNSKEMAVSLPVVIFAYEMIFHRSVRALVPVGVAIAITMVFILGKAYGAGSLMMLDAYRPQYTWTMYSETSTRYMNTMFYTNVFTMPRVLAVSALVLFVALWRKDRRLLLLWVWVMVTPLPIAFLSGRGFGCLYIVTAGWAAVVALLWEKIWQRLPQPALAMSFLILACGYTYLTADRHRYLEDPYLHVGDKTWALIEAFREGPPAPASGSTALILNDPFPNGYDTQFVAALWWRDRTLQVELQNQMHFSAEQVARLPYLFDFAGGKLKQIRP